MIAPSMLTESFYIAGGTLRGDAPCYVPRRADYELFDHLMSGHYCYVLTPRQMGKSSLMIRTARRLRDAGLKVAALDLTAAGQNLSVEQWYGGLLAQMGQQLDLEDELLDYWRDHAFLGPLQRWVSAIRERVLPRIRERLIIFIDEIDTVRSLPFGTDEFFAGIRELFNKRTLDTELNRLNFCLLGVATPTDLIRNPLITPFNIGHRIELLDFTEKEALQLAQGLNRDEITNQRLLKRIYYWTSGHPYLTQLLCHSVASDPTVRKEADVDRVCHDLFLSPRARERDDNLLFVRERLLRSEVDLTELLNQYSRIHGQTILSPVLDDEHSPVFNLLRLSGITRLERGVLVVRNRIYGEVFDQEWIRSNMPDGEIRRQKIAFRKGMRRIGMISAIIILTFLTIAIYASRQRNLARREEQNAQRLLYAAKMNLAAQAWETANITGLKELLDGAAPGGPEESYRGFEWSHFKYLLRRHLARFEHQDLVLTARFSPDSRILATAGKDNLVRLWDLSNRRLLAELRGHQNQIWRVAFSPDGKTLASAGWDNLVKLWDVESGREIHTLEGHTRYVCGLDFSPDGRMLASSSWGGNINFWDPSSGKKLRTLRGHRDWVWSVTFSRDGRSLVSTGEDKTVRIWDAATGRRIHTFADHKFSVYTAAFSPDGKLLVTGSSGGEIIVRDARTYSFITTLKGHTFPVNGLAFSPDGRYLASAGYDRMIRIWNASNWELADTMRGHSDEIRSIEFSRDGSQLVTASDDHGVNLWDAREIGRRDILLHRDDLISAARFTRDGTTLAVANLSTINFWDVESQKIKGQIRTDFQINDLAFSPDDRIIAAALRDLTVGLWNVKTRTLIGKLTGYNQWVFNLAFSPDGKYLATGDRAHKAILWDVAKRQRIHTFSVHESGVKAVAFSPDSRYLATAGDDKTIHIREVAGGRLIKSITGHANEIWTIEFSPDGKWLASAGKDRTIKIWDWRNGTEKFTLRGHSAGVKTLSYCADGVRLASGSEDGMIKLWDPLNGTELTTLSRQSSAITDLEFSPRHSLLVSGGKDRKVYLWRTGSSPED
ncbi:MAG: AAA-like domain-containing protein [Acidobacteriota bacterium]|nr:MAG: AAA-like domain-containing protein [Acidobacteriota bacterium]